ncbi:6-phosphogluconate dehydrogenase C-terminal domain-like protein, partial [Lepidopterella palustris CBS 459.81]
MELFPSNNPSLPQFSSLAYVYFGILVCSFLVTFDFTRFNKRKREELENTITKYGQFDKIAMIGCGSMGSGMALLFAENGLEVLLSDPSEKQMDAVIEKAKKEVFGERLRKYKDYKSLCASLSSPKLFVFSLPRGTVGDSVLEGLTPHLTSDNIILDCGNESFANTERRQKKCRSTGIHYLGIGVSGGHQAARAGPSMYPGGDEEALKTVMPLLEKVAAKDKHGNTCVGIVGRGSSGHYVNMVHNGIKHGMISAISEAWGIMKNGLGMDYEEIGTVFEKWSESGELRGMLLISIGADLSRKCDPSSDNTLVLPIALDKVVQDITGEEGTRIWYNAEAINLQIPTPTLHVSHDFRLASAYRGDRERAHTLTAGGWPPQKLSLSENGEAKAQFLEQLRQATYAACLASYIQGLNMIVAADKLHSWEIDYASILQTWKAGCVIQADYISEDLLAPIT